METNSEAYKEHLESKYLPGRDKYLRWFFYPKILKQFNEGEIMDFGFGTGEFLRYLRSKGRATSGIDSNPYLTEVMAKEGFDVTLDDITKLNTINRPVKNAVIDNVLEHLDMEQIDSVFSALKSKMEKGGILVVIVPLEIGYKRDPTHKVFVNPEIISKMCDKYHLKLKAAFHHPINISLVRKFFYLQMQVFTIQF